MLSLSLTGRLFDRMGAFDQERLIQGAFHRGGKNRGGASDRGAFDRTPLCRMGR